MFEIIFLAVLCGYFVQIVFILIGAKKQFPKLPPGKLPSATIIVAARNEEMNIQRCLESLDKIEYPEGQLEIIIVDDRSDDATGKIVEQFIAGKTKFRKIVSEKETGRLRGKTNALACGIKLAKGEIILTTDADCVVPATWAKTIASYYTENVAVVNGFTHQQFSNSFSGMQNLDFLYLLTVGCGTINMGKPLSCIGNNMSYRKSVYDEVGGYQSLPFSVTEDLNLLNAMEKLGKYKFIFPINRDSLVLSLPCPDFKSIYRQKKRWIVGGIKLPFYGYLLGLNTWLAALGIVLTPFLYTPTAGWLCFTKILLDFMLLLMVTTELNIRGSMKHFLAFEFYYLLYTIAAPFIVIPSRQVVWKDRTY